MNNFRTKVFTRAHEIRRSTGKSFAVCLSKSWTLYRLYKRMSIGEVAFTYEKVDGSLRKAYGTLKDVGEFIKGTGSPSNRTFQYFDTEVVGFRCFRVENLVSIF